MKNYTAQREAETTLLPIALGLLAILALVAINAAL